jgi:hypothetical protein
MTAVPLSSDGHLVTANDEGGWKVGEKKNSPSYWVAAAEKVQFWTWEGRTCLDGILVAGPQGRGRRGWGIVGTQYPNPVKFGEDLFVLDVRGELKPELTPHRSPPAARGIFGDRGSGWRRLRRLTAKAHGKLWEQVIERFSNETNIKALWQLLALHSVEISALRRGVVWDRLSIPSLTSAGELFFRPASTLAGIPFGAKCQQPFAHELDGTVVGVDAEMSLWQTSNNEGIVLPAVQEAVHGLATLELKENLPLLTFSRPVDPDDLASSRLAFDYFVDRRLTTMPFGCGLEGVLAAEAAQCVLNRRHPVVEWLLKNQENSGEDPNFSFLHSLACALLEEGSMEALATGSIHERRHNWHFSLLGYGFRNAELGDLASSLQPPYLCWHPDHGKFEITSQSLERLAEIQAIDWHRHEEERYI